MHWIKIPKFYKYVLYSGAHTSAHNQKQTLAVLVLAQETNTWVYAIRGMEESVVTDKKEFSDVPLLTQIIEDIVKLKYGSEV